MARSTGGLIRLENPIEARFTMTAADFYTFHDGRLAKQANLTLHAALQAKG